LKERKVVRALNVRSEIPNRISASVPIEFPASGRDEAVAVGVGFLVGVGVADGVAVTLGVGVGVDVALGVGVGVDVALGVGVAEGVAVNAGPSAA
jgi:hypothetical protein